MVMNPGQTGSNITNRQIHKSTPDNKNNQLGVHLPQIWGIETKPPGGFNLNSVLLESFLKN